MKMEFVIKTIVVPYVRMTQRSKHIDPRAIQYNTNQEAIKWELKQIMSQLKWTMFPRRTPLYGKMIFYGYNHKSDITNLGKAVEDALQGIALRDDRWFDGWLILRRSNYKRRQIVDVLISNDIRILLPGGELL